MISLLLVFSYIFFLCFGIGFLALYYGVKWGLIRKVVLGAVSPDIYVLTGFFILTTFLGFYNIFFPIDWVVNVIIFAGVYALIILHRKPISDLCLQYATAINSCKTALTIAIVAFAPVLVLLALFSVNDIQSFDTGLYHAQYIQWIEKFKTPPGLAWIHGRFAFNSHFHVASAFFTLSSLKLRNENFSFIVLYPLNSFIFLMFAVRCVYKITRHMLNKTLFLPVVYSGLLFCSFYIFGPKVQSPMPDIAVTIIIFYAFLLFLEKFERSRDWTLHQVVIFFAILVLPTFKLSAGFLVLLIIPLLWGKSFGKLWPMAAGGFIIVLPFLLRNVILSGYLVYGLPQLDIVNPEWKIPYENVVADNAVIKAWAIIPYRNYQEVLALPLAEWLPIWWENYGVELNRFVLLSILISPLLMLLFWWKGRKSPWDNVLILYPVLMVNIAFWFISAPDPRFAWGFLYFHFALCVAVVFSFVRTSKALYIAGFLIFYLQYHTLLRSSAEWTAITNADFLDATRWYPKQIPAATTKTFPDGTFELFVPVNTDGKCYGHRVPCTPYPLSGVRMRGNSLDDGFVYDTTIQ